MSVYDRLKERGIELPPLAIPAAAYVPFVRTGHLVFVSGHIAKREGKPWVGQLGRDIHADRHQRPLVQLQRDTRQPSERESREPPAGVASSHEASGAVKLQPAIAPLASD